MDFDGDFLEKEIASLLYFVYIVYKPCPMQWTECPF